MLFKRWNLWTFPNIIFAHFDVNVMSVLTTTSFWNTAGFLKKFFFKAYILLTWACSQCSLEKKNIMIFWLQKCIRGGVGGVKSCFRIC